MGAGGGNMGGMLKQLQKMQALYQLAQNPASQLSPEKVEMAIIENMGISNIDSLLKENDER
jgi:hypothetical protein